MRKKYLPLLAVILLATGCIETYSYTVKIRNSSLYSEVYNFNPAGVDKAYLTDSVNFRVYIGKFDNEHEVFKYLYKGDSITVYKMAQDSAGMMKVSDQRTLSIGDLSRNKMNSTKPLFEFK